MKAKFYIVPSSTADPEPADPAPTPFPIKIVSDVPPPPESATGQDGDTMPSGKRTDEFYPAWKKFLAVQSKQAKSSSRTARKVDEEKIAVENSAGDGLHVQENAATSWDQAAGECRAKVAAIVDECKRLNQKYRDPVFDLEATPYCLQSLSGRFPKAVDRIDAPPWIKRVEDIFDDPQFFIDGAAPNDVHQGSSGDCWFLAALMAVSAKKELIDRLCVARDEKVGVYGFVFFRDGEWIYEVVDDKLFLRVGDDDDLSIVRDWGAEKRKDEMSLKYDDEKLKNVLQKGGEALYFSHCKSNETWLPLIEKAYAKAHGDYCAIEGGFASEGIEDLTGGVGVVLNPEDIMDKDRFWREQLSQVNIKYLFGGGSKPSPTKGFVGGHAYAVLQAWEEGDLKMLKLRNPWGDTEWEGDWSDGSKLWTPDMMTKLNHTFGDDGVFWISYKDFLKHFPAINRVRLFDSGWSVAQQWTCVNVPWTVDYLDTKFQFTVSEKGPVVVVLSQPDDRYFYGLRGRYLFSMHFRVCKAGEEDAHWIVRSMHNSGNETIFTRSVSAEIEDLEPGTYDVIFKVTATRSPETLTAEEVVLKYAVDRKEKLLRVGRRFDYAQTKGNLEAMEETNKAQAKEKLKGKRKTTWKKARKISQQGRERARLRKKRVNDAMRDKRKEFEQKQREKSRVRKKAKKAKKAKKEAENGSTEAQADTTTTTTEQTRESKSATMTPPADEEEKEPEPESVPENETSAEDKDGAAALTSKLSKLDLDNQQDAPQDSPSSTMEDDQDDEEYDSPIEPPDELEDDDFDWDSDMDGPIYSSEEDHDDDDDDDDPKNDLFADDPWNAMCVLGLRVYSKTTDAKVSIVKNEKSS